MGVLNYIATLLLFAGMEVASKPLMGSVDPLVLTLWRFLSGAAVLGTVLLLKRRPLGMKWRSVAPLALMGVLNTFLSMSLLQLAVKHTTASRAATIFCSNPVFVVVAASLMGWEKLSGKRILGLLLGVGGLVLVTGLHRMSVDSGTIYALLASITFALYMIIGRRASLKLDPLVINTLSFLFGTAALSGWLLLRGVSLSPQPLFRELPVFLFMGIGVSGIGYMTFMGTIRKMGAGNASTIFLLKPAVTTLLAVALLGEGVSLHFAAGLLLAGAGSWLVAAGGARPLQKPS